VRGSYGFDFIHSQARLKNPMVRKDGTLSWYHFASAIPDTAGRHKWKVISDGVWQHGLKPDA
jgi:predicted molibdopterin-dependent oxidoreductase YjgC